MHPTHFARSNPDKLALIMPELNVELSYAEMDARANQAAHLFRKVGLQRGDTVAIVANNCVDYYVAWWGAQRSGLYFNGIPTTAAAAEIAYIVCDCVAKVLILSSVLGVVARKLVRDASRATPELRAIYSLEGTLDDVETWRDALARMPSTTPLDLSAGSLQPYSSGSTGTPKGLRYPLSTAPYDAFDPLMDLWTKCFGYTEDMVYLAPGPLSHTLTLTYSTLAHRVGGAVILMKRFEPKAFLELVEKYRVTTSQMVPMMFVRLLKMPDAERTKFDVSSLRSVIHSAAPCSPDIKRAMIQWWGPIIHEFYSGSEGFGGTIISSQEWIERPGAVGKPSWGVPHICGPDGAELPNGEIGAIYFDGPSQVQVLNDPAKTAKARHPRHKSWATFGDVGYMDDAGYVYLIDRAAFVAHSGEHVVYPQETENILIAHPRIADAAVFGAPDETLGDKLVAVVQPLKWSDAGLPLADELMDYCRAKLAPQKCPALIKFEAELPRSESGKLHKRQLQERCRRADNE